MRADGVRQDGRLRRPPLRPARRPAGAALHTHTHTHTHTHMRGLGKTGAFVVPLFARLGGPQAPHYTHTHTHTHTHTCAAWARRAPSSSPSSPASAARRRRTGIVYNVIYICTRYHIFIYIMILMYDTVCSARRPAGTTPVWYIMLYIRYIMLYIRYIRLMCGIKYRCAMLYARRGRGGRLGHPRLGPPRRPAGSGWRHALCDDAYPPPAARII